MIGVEIKTYHVHIDEAREEFGDELAEMSHWFNGEGYNAELDALEAEFGLEMTDRETYFHEHGRGKAIG